MDKELVNKMLDLDLNNCETSDIWLTNNVQAKYENHRPIILMSRHTRFCVYCGESRPASLEELTSSVILENPELLKKAGSALSHLPHRLSCLIGHAFSTRLNAEARQLVEFVSEDKTHLSWFCADNLTIFPLLRFRFYCEVYQKLNPFMECPSKGIEEILQYLSNFDNKYEDFWSSMISAMKTLKTEIDLGVFKNVSFTDESNAVPVNIFQLIGNRPRWFDSIETKDEYKSMKKLQKLNKTTAYPIVFQATSVEHRNLHSRKIPTLLEDIDPQLISEILLTKASSWSVANINALEDVLSACKNLSCLYLAQKIDNRDTPEDAAEAILRLLGKRPQISELGFAWMTLGGALGKYPLPEAVDELCLVCCKLTPPGFEGIQSQSELALKHLEVIYNSPDYIFQGLYEFIREQVHSLEWLALDFHLLAPTEYLELLKLMAKFDKLQKLHLICFLDIDFSVVENIVSAFMSIRSAKSFFIDFALGLDVDELKSRMTRLLQVMKSSCTLNRRPPLNLKLTQGRISHPCTELKTFWSLWNN